MKQVIQSILKRYIGLMIILVIFIFINMYVLTLPAKIIGVIIDYMADREVNQTAIITCLLYLLGSVLLYLLTRIPWRTLGTYISRGFERELKNKIFDQFIHLKLADIQNIKNGELMSYLTKDIGELRACFYRIMNYGIRMIALGIVGIYTMVSGISTPLTIVTLIPIIITAFAVLKIKKYVEQNFKKARQYFTELSEFVQESTDSIRTTKAYSGEMSQVKQFIQKNRKLKKSNIAVDINSTLLSTCINIGFGLCYGITILYGSHLILQNTITLGDFIAFNGYIALFYDPVSWLPGIISRYKRAQVSFHRLDKLFKLEREKINLRNIEKQEEIKGDIVIKNLSYNYPTTIEVALSQINLTIPEGRTLGIIGTIGSGKTTLMNLLLKLYPVERGKITIEGKDINDIPTESLRNNICYITQDNFLFSTTLRENVSLFKEGYDDEDIIKSTKKAKMKEEIDEMENGIDTIIGERGVDLSGGQKQRVVISRAFLQASNIIVFDDTFSALDNKTEEQVLKNVKSLTKGKTCIIISNRISDVKDADEIIVLEEGKIIQQGTHQTLSHEEGLYQKFYLQQSSETE